MLRLKEILSPGARFVGSSALSVLVLAFALISLPRPADAAGPKDRPANRPQTQTAVKKRPQPAAASKAELRDRYATVTKALEALEAARQQVETYGNETVAAARQARAAALGEAFTDAADFFLEAAAALAPKPLKAGTERVNKAYKNAREHVKAVREAGERSGTIAGLRAVVGDIEMVTGTQFESGIAKLRAGFNALDAENKVREGKAAESAIATMKIATEMADALGNKEAAKPWKAALGLLSSANNYLTSWDNAGKAADLEGDGRILQSVQQRITEGEVALRAKQVALFNQIHGELRPVEIPRLVEIPRYEVVKMPKYEPVKVPNLERFEVQKFERLEIPKPMVLEIPKPIEMVRVPGSPRECSSYKDVIDALNRSIAENRIGESGARAAGIPESAAAYAAMIRNDTQELGRLLAEYEKCRR